MSVDINIGLYGKLPAYGDFISRNLPVSVINMWDEWLQHYISGSKEELGDAWLDIYLTSPIWRFVLSPGVMDGNTWAGLIMPSVDRVGRYFPVSLLYRLDAKINPVKFMLEQNSWFNTLEAHCLSALNGQIDADQLINNLAVVPLTTLEEYDATMNLGQMGPVLIALDDKDLSMTPALPYMLNAALATGLSSYSVWQTMGSELIGPLMFHCQGLPPIGGIASMIDGQWQQRDWKIPYNKRYM